MKRIKLRDNGACIDRSDWHGLDMENFVSKFLFPRKKKINIRVAINA